MKTIYISIALLVFASCDEDLSVSSTLDAGQAFNKVEPIPFRQTDPFDDKCSCKNGQPGPQGERGPQGYPGADGQRGYQGQPGKNGQQGIPGVPGPPGAVGQAGVKGDKGDTGPRGNTGPQGALGPQGEIGPSGAKGSNGLQGAKGDRGQDGHNSIIRIETTSSGKTIVQGIDTDDDGILSPEEETDWQPLQFTNWNPGSPDNSLNNEFCAFVSKGWGGTWDDRDCDIWGNYSCRTSRGEIFLSQSAGPWRDGPKNCWQEGGTFTMPTNMNENRIIFDNSRQEFNWIAFSMLAGGSFIRWH